MGRAGDGSDTDAAILFVPNEEGVVSGCQNVSSDDLPMDGIGGMDRKRVEHEVGSRMEKG